MAEIDRCQRRDGVDHQQRRVFRAIDRLADLANPRGDAGRGLVVHDEHGLDRVTSILGQFGFDADGFDAVPPIGGDHIDVETQTTRDVGPEPPELANLERQDAIAGRQRVDQRRFPRPRS